MEKEYTMVDELNAKVSYTEPKEYTVTITQLKNRIIAHQRVVDEHLAIIADLQKDITEMGKIGIKETVSKDG